MTARAPLALAAALCACGAMGVVLRSEHYRVALPDGWVVEEAGGGDEPAVVRVPCAPADKTQKPLELRIYAWLTPPSDSEPVDEVVTRLAGDDEAAMRAAGVEDAEQCRDLRRSFVMFGTTQRAARLRTKTGHLLVVTAGRSAGSTVGVTGFVPDREPFCANVVAIEAAIDVVAPRLVGQDLGAAPRRYMFTPADIQNAR